MQFSQRKGQPRHANSQHTNSWRANQQNKNKNKKKPNKKKLNKCKKRENNCLSLAAGIFAVVVYLLLVFLWFFSRI